MTGNTLAHYEVLSLLGRGGMGEVHRAKDTKLGREVALKFLPEDFAADPERLARFRREAQVLASLHHPNIASIFGLEEAEGRVFLSMELAEGSDLSERIAKGPIPEDEALDIATQIAAGLEEAHEKGVVHRDLKPANVKLGTDGKVKILDFGLARAFAGETAEERDGEHSPTITAAMSKSGVILGTAAYMSPEQARGKTVDRRADIWAFGVLLFEMLSGFRLFEGDTVSDTLAGVLRAEIEWDRLPEETSPGMRRLLERCLERDPLSRLRDVGEARIFLAAGAKNASILGSASSFLSLGDEPGAGTVVRRGVPLAAAGALALVLAVAGTLFGWQVLGRPAPAALLNMTLPAPEEGVFHLISSRPGPAAISPDGTMVTYSIRDESGTVRLYLRRLDTPKGTVVSGTEGAAYPFWSPDSRYIAFTGEGKLKKVAVAGGPPVTLCAAENMKGGSWNESGDILFAPSHQSGIHRVSASGGKAVAITTIDTQNEENSHRHPRFLPDGRQFLYLARLRGGAERENRVVLASLDADSSRVLTVSQAAAEYSAGHLLTVRENILLATPFDPVRGELDEGGVPLAEDILMISQGAACAVASPTLDGMLVYQTTKGASERGLMWIGEAGAQLGAVGEPGELFRPAISPDGTQAVVEVLDPETEANDLWLVDLDSGLRSRFTFAPGPETTAQWMPDGAWVVYAALVDSIYRIVMQPVEGTGGAAILYEDDRRLRITGVSPDAKTLVVGRDDPELSWNGYLLDVETGSLEPRIRNERVEAMGGISPDGRWLVYASQTASTWEVLVEPVAGGSRRWQVDDDGGLYPFWGPDGTKLYYIGFAGEIQEVSVDGSGSTFRAGAPRTFSRTSPPTAGGLAVSIHPDGDRILHVSGDVSDDETGYLHVVTDWRRGLAN